MKVIFNVSTIIEQLTTGTKKRKGRQGRLPRLPENRGVELEYQKQIQSLIKELKSGVKTILIEPLPYIIQERDQLKRVDASPADKIAQLLNATTLYFESVLTKSRIRSITEKIASSINVKNQQAVKRMFKKAIGIDLEIDDPLIFEQMKMFNETNASLIKNIGDDLMKDIEQTVLNGVQRGFRAKDISQSILGSVGDMDGFRGRFKKAETRAKLIARDQVLTLNSNINQARQQSVGVKKYIWRTANDDRVRERHEELDGEVFFWDKSKSENGKIKPQGHLNPGEEINCRCYAEPIIEV